MGPASTSLQDQDHMARVLAVVLQHAAVSSNPKLICTLLQVCKAWRRAIPQTAAGAVMVSLQVGSTADGLAKLANFTAWITKYPGLLQGISIICSNKNPPAPEGMSRTATSTTATFIRALEDMLRMSLQQVQLLSAQTAQQTPAAAQHAVQPLLRLQRFSSNIVHRPSVLSHLPANSLTCLKLIFPHDQRGSRMHPSGLPGAAEFGGMLQQFSNLQRLQLVSSGGPLPSPVAESISHLSQLTRLLLSTIGHTAQLQLPAHLQQLTLSIAKSWPPVAAAADTTAAVLQLAYLTSLQSLDLSVADVAIADGSVLPPCLTSLTATCKNAITTFHIESLQQLQELTIVQSTDSPEHLQSLTSLAQLQQLALTYRHSLVAPAASPVWSQLPQLSSLKLEVMTAPAVLGQLMLAIRDLVPLTELDIRLKLESGSNQPYSVLAFIKPLTNLQALTVAFRCMDNLGYVNKQEALHLTALNQLTYLDLHRITPAAVEDPIAIALSLHLTKLEWLKLGKVSTCVMPAVGMLKNLKHLYVQHFVTQEDALVGLQFLTGLKALTHLDGFRQAGTAPLMRFWGIVKGSGQEFVPDHYL